jgi:hypothetical protein
MKYRYRTGDALSGWMQSDELRAHAADGRIKPDSVIQRVGKEEWVPASKVPGLWNGNSGGSTVTGEAVAENHGAESHRDASEPHSTGGAGIVHPSRLGESIQHLLQRAVLGQITVSAPEFDAPQRAILAGVTSDSVALEFEACETVVYIPWTRVRSVSVPSKEAHSLGKIRSNTEHLIIDVDRMPATVLQNQHQS